MEEIKLYEDDQEKQHHTHAVHILAENVSISEIELLELYENVLREYKRNVKIKNFLPILVAKKVRELLEVGKNQR
jgi:hypothetical protein